MSFQETWKYCSMSKHTKHPYNICTNLVGRKIILSLLMNQCKVVGLVFHDILFFMTELKNKNNTTSICGELFRWKGSPIFARKLYHWISKISWNICFGVNKWHAKCKILAEFGKHFWYCKRKDYKIMQYGWYMFYVV